MSELIHDSSILRRVNDAKSALLKELEQFVVPFLPSRVDNILKGCLTESQCEGFLRSKRQKVYKSSQWQIPENPSSEACLYEPIQDVIHAILVHFKLRDTRKVHNPNDEIIPVDDFAKITTPPNLFIAAAGPHFQRTLDDRHWSQCLSTVEIKAGDHLQGLDKLLTPSDHFARQTLTSQPTRSFVYSIVMTQQYAMLFCFDRVGAQYSEWIDYRKNPSQLVRLIYFVCNPDLKSLGIDETVVFKDGQLEFTMERDGQPVTITADPEPLFPPFGLWGRATVCWPVEDEKGDSYILKQQFVSVARTPEHEFLEDLQCKDDIDLRHIGMCAFGQKYGKISEARGMEEVPESFPDRFLYRILLEQHGDTIDVLEGKTRLDVVVALRDAILGHRALWEGSILHRDVSHMNILYKKKRDEGSPLGGVIIDCDLSVHIEREKGNHKVDINKGTRAFQSSTILLCQRTEEEVGHPLPNILHDHLDDLESFFWVLLYITRENVGPGEDENLFRDGLRVRDTFESDPDRAYNRKLAFLSASKFIALQAGWGAAVKALVINLATFFNKEHTKKLNDILGPAPRARSIEEILRGSRAHYTTVLKLFNTAIATIKKEMKNDTAQEPLVDNQDSDAPRRTRSGCRPNQQTAKTRLGNQSAAPKAAPPRTSFKRPRETGPETSTAASVLVPPQAPAAKRVRMLRDGEKRITRSASLKLKANGTVDARGNAGAGDEAGPSSSRSAGGRGRSTNSSKSVKTPRVGLRTSQRLARQSGLKPT
ncbi:hypothetical protein CVT24_001029 [Panaeolus cyanescens]|uniref:Fungal-type protein kinase domain-containing protein n=1 Tax=Panaeolus cyanescens TaxID=181874 RepID=A0A409YTG4_9AGAR|nr:hypothetical protein CVT24_001029 [Panaeolus cyanescens]